VAAVAPQLDANHAAQGCKENELPWVVINKVGSTLQGLHQTVWTKMFARHYDIVKWSILVIDFNPFRVDVLGDEILG
jgi:hypothetical protein